MNGTWEQILAYVSSQYNVLWADLLIQLRLVLVASIATVVIGVPVGILVTGIRVLKNIVLKIAGVLYTIPVLAMFGLLIPIFGIGNEPALIALTIYGILPILQNTCIGIAEVSPAVLEASRGMGASNAQLLFKIRLPLAMPAIMAGIRTSVVMNISVATFAVFIGAGGLGTVIMQGIRTFQNGMLIPATVLVALVAMAAERLLALAEKAMARNVR